MESKKRLVLKHREHGLYWSNVAEHTKKLFDAKRFTDEESAKLWMEVSIYKPDHPEEYDLVPINMTIEEVQSDVQEK